MSLPPEMVCFREGERKGRLVLLPGLDPDISHLRRLAEGIGGTGGVYAIDLFRLAAANEDALTIEALARHSCALLQAAGGADAIAGYSFGGLVAYEMARIVWATGEPTQVALIDAVPAEIHWPRPLWLASMGHRLLQHSQAILRLPPREALAELARRAGGLTHRVRRRATASPVAARAGPQPLYERLAEAYHQYDPGPLAGRLTLIESSDPMFATPASSIWRPLVSELRALRYTGNHLDAIQSQVSARAIAAALNGSLSAD